MNINLPGPSPAGLDSPGQGTLGQNPDGAFPQQFNKIAPQEMAMRQKVMVGQASRPGLEQTQAGVDNGQALGATLTGLQPQNKTVSSEPQIQQFQPNKSMVFGKSAPNQPPQSPGPGLATSDLARLNPVYILAGVSLLLWSLFWLNYFGIIYLGEYLPFLPTR